MTLIIIRPHRSLRMGLFLGVRYAGVSIFGVAVYANPFHFRRNFKPTRNEEEVDLHCMFEIVSSYMNGRFSVIPEKTLR